MKQTLKSFRFNPEKSGQVLNRYVKASGMSGQEVADELGYTYDIVNNITHGKNKELILERAFKICVLTGHSICEYLRDMLKDEDIDFADKIHVLRETDFALVPYTETVVQDTQKTETSVQNTVNLAVVEQNPMYQAAYQAMMQQAASTHQANLDRFRAIHEGYTKMLEDSHKKALDDQEKAHQEHIATVRKVARQRLKWIILLTVLLLVFISWFVWDLTHPDVGLIRVKQAGFFLGTYL